MSAEKFLVVFNSMACRLFGLLRALGTYASPCEHCQQHGSEIIDFCFHDQFLLTGREK
ncbi:hypothetical protein [Akkermansia muciniphila]|uniref:hypothetical protein n=1 Tax=Akkermansia muciniphila TaxID=239935 RepID=UPI001CA4B1F5|nr:hypothetical protein [Akkermansia muciniphila]